MDIVYEAAESSWIFGGKSMMHCTLEAFHQCTAKTSVWVADSVFTSNYAVILGGKSNQCMLSYPVIVAFELMQ